VFTEEVKKRPDSEAQEFRNIVGEKMNALADAWHGGTWNAVMFLDADLMITAPILDCLGAIEGQVLLTPNYYPKGFEGFVAVHGYYNSGFVLTRSREFHEWWAGAFATQPAKWTDQAVLNEVGKHFTVTRLPESANVGFWRSAGFGRYAPIPPECMFLHAHFFQPLQTTRNWIDRAFAMHCLEFLQASSVPEHRILFDEITTRDSAGWYKASLQLRR
jgi:hypothetical protein